jgi:hypothetical protein
MGNLCGGPNNKSLPPPSGPLVGKKPSNKEPIPKVPSEKPPQPSPPPISIVLPPFKGFQSIENLQSIYAFSAKIPSKPDQELYTRVGGGFNTKFLIKTISKATSRSFTPEEKKQLEN